MENILSNNRVFAGATVYVLLAEALQRVIVGIKEGEEKEESWQKEKSK